MFWCVRITSARMICTTFTWRVHRQCVDTRKRQEFGQSSRTVIIYSTNQGGYFIFFNGTFISPIEKCHLDGIKTPCRDLLVSLPLSDRSQARFPGQPAPLCHHPAQPARGDSPVPSPTWCPHVAPGLQWGWDGAWHQCPTPK